MRVVLTAFAVVVMIWAVAVYPTLRSEQRFAGVAARVIGGEPYRPETIAAVAASAEGAEDSLRPSALGKVAVLRLSELEQSAGSADAKDIDQKLGAFRGQIHRAIAGTPGDPFLWLMLYWLDNRQHGFRQEDLRDLRMSYVLGPREAWIAVKRSRMALGLFSGLDSGLADAATAEFAGLVQSRLFYEAADIIEGPGRPVRDHLLESLKDVKDGAAFTQLLYDRGMDDVPHVKPSRPWLR